MGFPLEQRDGPWGSDQAEHGDTSSLLRVREFQSKTAGPFAYASRHPPGIGFIRIPVNPVRGGSSQFRAAGPERAASPGRAGLGRAGRQSRQVGRQTDIQTDRLPRLASLRPWPDAAPSDPEPLVSLSQLEPRGGNGAPSLLRPGSLPFPARLRELSPAAPSCLPAAAKEGGRGAAAGRTSGAGTGAQPPGFQGEGWGQEGARQRATRRRHRAGAAPGSPAGGGAAVWRREGPTRAPERGAERSGGSLLPAPSLPLPSPGRRSRCARYPLAPWLPPPAACSPWSAAAQEDTLGAL